tara:strand:+ start:2070 stop:2264 length:195 start_codon:yes stop_codon:yes gene_type:complete
MEVKDSQAQRIPYKAMSYPVDEFGRLGGLFSLVDLPVAKYVKYQDLSEEDQKKVIESPMWRDHA